MFSYGTEDVSWCGPAKIGIPNNDDLTKAHTSAQLSLQAQQNENAQNWRNLDAV
jgi:hypothetical protein